MRYVILTVCLGICIVGLCAYVPRSSAQEEGFIRTERVMPSYQDMLPPGAVHKDTQVLHRIASEQENLHLLAGYYFGNPRRWKEIYRDNRDVIKNPNRLPVGETIRIQVGQEWRPLFSYQEWFKLATRNGEWKSGVPWQRAVKVAPSGEQVPSPVFQQTSATPAPFTEETPSPTSVVAEGTVSSEDREKFIGTWNGKYGCGTPNIDDQIVIVKNSNDLGVSITIHGTFMNPDNVTGTLTEKNVITVPEQSMGGAPGTAKITYLEGDSLEYSQTGFGMTCGGAGYTKAAK